LVVYSLHKAHGVLLSCGKIPLNRGLMAAGSRQSGALFICNTFLLRISLHTFCAHLRPHDEAFHDLFHI
jgi:hypothetical protein